MKYLVYLGLALTSLAASAYPQDHLCDRYPNLCAGPITYTCHGQLVSGTITITPLDHVTAKAGNEGIAYRSVARLMVGGRPYALKGSGNVWYGKSYLDRYGTWEPNYDKWMYNIFGAQAPFNPSHTPMYLEVNYGGSFFHPVKGYMKYWADDAPDDPRFNFSCSHD